MNIAILTAVLFADVTIQSSQLKVLGRHVVNSDGGIQIDWPGSGLALEVTGATSVSLSASSYYGSGGLAESRFNVVVIEEDFSTIVTSNITINNNQTLEYPILWDLSSEHTYNILISKTTEANNIWLHMGLVVFHSITLDKGIAVPGTGWWGESGRKLEIVGDSITAGFGCGGLNKTEPNCDGGVYENTWLSWATVTSQILRAEYHIEAWSAAGLLFNAVSWLAPANMSTMYTWNLATLRNNKDNIYNFTSPSFSPDAIIINLGTNDYANYHPAPTPQQWTDAYLQLATRIHEARKVPIFAICGPWIVDNGLECSNIKAAVTAGVQKGIPIKYISLESPGSIPQNRSGCAGHPSQLAQHVMGVNVANYISSHLGW